MEAKFCVPFLVAGLILSTLGVLLAYRADNLLSPTTADIQAPFWVLIVGCIITLLAFPATLRSMTARIRLAVGLAFVTCGMGVPLTMTLSGAALNVHTWTFYIFLPVVELLGLGAILIFSGIGKVRGA